MTILLPPEIYPVIASHIPLYATPPTLLALALASQEILEIVLPILHSRLILKDEAAAVVVLDRLIDEPSFGRAVRELHILSDLSVETQIRGTPLDVVSRFEHVISNGSLPFIHTLSLSLGRGWYYRAERNFEQVQGFGRFSKEVWKNLRTQCPRLSSLILRGFEDGQHDPWMEESAFLDVVDLTRLTLHLGGGLLDSCSDMLLRRVASNAHSLQTLDLAFLSETTPTIFGLDIPHLRSFSIAQSVVLHTKRSMSFFERHPALEFIDIGSNAMGEGQHWFSSEVNPGFLPDLRYLRARWVDARRLAPILNQLLGLAITRSINAQVPYLFREILPEGLPNLKSLTISQAGANIGAKKIEGAHWYEEEDGTFRQIKPNRNRELRTIFNGYMHSIVRAAPNIEELGFKGGCPLDQFPSIAAHLCDFSNLKRLSYNRQQYDNPTPEDLRIFAQQTADVFEVVPGLCTITNAATLYPPYLTATAKRDEGGALVDVKLGREFGIVAGYEDEAFPGPWPT